MSTTWKMALVSIFEPGRRIGYGEKRHDEEGKAERGVGEGREEEGEFEKEK